MAAPGLKPNFLFGLRTDLGASVYYLEENIFLYPCGHNVVLFNSETRAQRVVQGSKPSGAEPVNITAMAVSPNKKYLAMAETGPCPAVTIYDTRTLKKRKVLSSAAEESDTRSYVSVCFSPDSKRLLTLSGSPDFKLTCWLWEMVKPMETTTLQIAKDERVPDLDQRLCCSFNPADPAQVLVAGSRLLRRFRVDSTVNGFVRVKLEASGWEHGRILAHTWVDERRFVLATQAGDLALFDKDEFRELVIAADSVAPVPVTAVTTYVNGLVAGLRDGAIVLLERSEKGRALSFERTRSYSAAPGAGREAAAPSSLADAASSRGDDAGAAPANDGDNDDDDGDDERAALQAAGTAAVIGLAVSISEDNLAVSTEAGQLLQLRMFDTDSLKASDRRLEPVVDSFHSGAVTALDTCVRKPLVATVGEDCTVRVWNFVEKRVELTKRFNDAPLSVSMHPSGLHLIVGFQDKVQLMNLLMDSISTFKELPIKACTEVQFSNGGHAFAAVTGTVIVVYNFYTCELLHTVRMHNGLVRSVHWSLDDTTIVTAGMDGAVYERVLGEGHRKQEWVQKSCHFTSALSTADGKIYAVGDDRFLKEIVNSTVHKELDAGVVLTQVAVSHPPQRMLFVGTETGIVRAFKFPLTGECKDVVCHAGPVVRLCVSADDGSLFSVGADGTLAIFDVQERDGRMSKRERADAVPFTEEILVTKSELEEKNAVMNDLKTQVDELTVHNAYQLRLHDITYQDKLKEVTEKYNLQLEHDRSKYEMLKDEKQDIEMEYEEKVKLMEDAHARKLHELDLEHQQAIMDEVKRYHQLERQMESEVQLNERETAEREVRHQASIEQLRDSCGRELQSEDQMRARVEAQKKLVHRKFEETTTQLEQDTDKEIEELKGKYEAKLTTERDATLRLKGENGIMKKKFSALKKDIEDQKEEIKAMLEKEQELYAHISELETEIQRHKAEIDERDVTIGEKETEIYDLKKDNQELEKFKYVLDYQIKELKRQIEPRENEIERMKDQVMGMDGQLETYHRENRALEATVKDLKEQLQQQQRDIKAARQGQREAEGRLEKLRTDLEVAMSHIQNPAALRQHAERMLREHGIKPTSRVEMDPEVEKEFQRQRRYLEKSVESLKRELVHDTRARKNDNMRIIQENVALIREINELRRTIKAIRIDKRAVTVGKGASSPRSPRSPRSPGGSRRRAERRAASEQRQVLDMQRQQMELLRAQIEEEEEALAAAAAAHPDHHASKQRLQPVDAFAGAAVAE